MIDVPVLNLGEYVKKCEWVRGVCIYETCQDPRLDKIFEYEKKRAGLSRTDITLQIPENNDDAVYVDSNMIGLARTDAFEPGSYNILLNMGLIDRYSFLGITERNVIRHELAHIRNGDCDISLPWGLKVIYHWLFAEPRAMWYQFFG